MPTDSTARTLVILAALAVLAGVIWLVRDILPPFLIALVLALLLDPLMARMQRAGLPRGLAVAFTFLAFLSLFAAVLVFMVPRTISQVADLARNVGPYQFKVQAFADAWMREHAADLRRLRLPESMPDFVRRYQGEILRYVQILLTRVFGALETTAGAIGWVIVVPIVTLYLLADMEKLRARLIYVVPPRHREMVLELAGKVGRVFVAYLRGLMLICACYGIAVYLALGLWLALPYALILSLAAAILYSVPYLGQFTLIAICASVAWLTGRAPFYIGEVAVALVVIGQCFDQFITPRVIGKQVGLHPVIGLFALMTGAQFCGPIGMVFAVPVAASVRVVLIQLFPRLGEPIPASEESPLAARRAGGTAEIEATAPLPSAESPTSPL